MVSPKYQFLQKNTKKVQNHGKKDQNLENSTVLWFLHHILLEVLVFILLAVFIESININDAPKLVQQ